MALVKQRKRKGGDGPMDEFQASATKGKRGKQPTLSPEVALPPPEVFEVEALEEQYASDYMLKMEPGPPIYPYLNSTYHIVVHLVDRQNHLVIGHNVPLHVELLFESGEPVPNPTEVLTMHPADPVIAGTGQIRIAMTFMQLSLQQGGRSFLVRVSAAENSVTPPLGEIESKTSLPLKVVKYQLVATSQPDPDWYKDEKGASNCMIVKGELVDALRRRVLNSNLPLRFALLYESTEKLKDQSLLSVLNINSKKRIVVHDDGTFEVRYRVSQVSSNHLNQMFCIMIEADDEMNPQHQEVSACISAPVRVWSKRNFNRGRKSDGSYDEPDTPSTLYEAAVHTMRAASVAARTAESGNAYAGSLRLPPRQPEPEVHPQSHLDTTTLLNWSRFVSEEYVRMEWQVIGYEVDETTGAEKKSRPLQRCPSCHVIRDYVNQQLHASDCRLNSALIQFNNTIMPMLMPVAGDAPVPSAFRRSFPGVGSVRRADLDDQEIQDSTAAVLSKMSTMRSRRRMSAEEEAAHDSDDTAPAPIQQRRVLKEEPMFLGSRFPPAVGRMGAAGLLSQTGEHAGSTSVLQPFLPGAFLRTNSLTSSAIGAALSSTPLVGNSAAWTTPAASLRVPVGGAASSVANLPGVTVPPQLLPIPVTAPPVPAAITAATSLAISATQPSPSTPVSTAVTQSTPVAAATSDNSASKLPEFPATS